MKIEGVIICVNYPDFLAHTLPHNKHHFDRLVVVTDTKDEATRRICEHYYVECIQTDVFYENGDAFNKGKGINEGLKRLSCEDWIIHLDADMYLPPLTRSILDRIPLDNNTIYGIDRMMCPDYNAWMKYLNNPKPLHEGWVYVHPTAFPMGVRIAEYMSQGYEPIGYFQMWNARATGIKLYPDQHGACDRTDVIHAKKFGRFNRQLLPELIGIHLESESLNLKSMGKNWNGRKTKIFGPEEQKISEIVEEVILKPRIHYVSLLNRIIFWFRKLIHDLFGHRKY